MILLVICTIFIVYSGNTFRQVNACNDNSDICFVLDSSGSEGAVNFHKQLEFIQMIVHEFKYDGTQHTQICVVTFSTTAVTEIHLGQFNTESQIIQNVYKVPYRDGETETDLGLENAIHALHHTGARANVSKVMIVLTDGISTEPSQTRTQAAYAHRLGIETFAIGIGRAANTSELHVIATDNRHVFQVHNFSELQFIHQQVVNIICERAPTTTIRTTTLPPTTTKAACGIKPADIVFVLDSSDSEGLDNFQIERDFVHHFAAQFSIGANNVQFSVVTYSTDIRNDFFFNNFSTRAQVLHAIQNIQYMGKGTNTSAALQFVRQNNLSPKYGARVNATKFVIVITDGLSDEPEHTRQEANLLKAVADVISIGVGPRVDKTELANIASNHRVLTVESFSLLLAIKNQLTDLACQSG